MDSLIPLLYFIFTFVFVYFFISITRRKKPHYAKLPPGPVPSPIVGNLLELGNKPHKSLAKLAANYGPIVALKLGRVTTIVISNATAAREVLQKHDLIFADRSIPHGITANKHDQFSVAWLPVEAHWKTLRKICNYHIFTSQRLDAKQDLRRLKVQKLLTHVQESCQAGVAVEIGKAAFNTSLNLLSNTIFSVDLADPESGLAREFQKLVCSIMENIGRPNLADYFPLLKMIDPQRVKRRLTRDGRKITKLLQGLIDDRLLSRKAKHSQRKNDLLDTLLDLVEEKFEGFDWNDLEHLLLDLYTAGTDTTSITLEWALAEMLHKPSTLLKAREELKRVIGKGNAVEESDIAKLPYLQAVLKETFRLHPATPMLLPRKVKEDVEVMGFTVPKDAQVLVNAWAIGRDPNVWSNPNSFEPERFLGSDVDVKGQNFELIPFGAGRRICPGLPLAVRMLHFMLASLLHAFDWKLEGGMTPEDLDMEDEFGITLRKAQPLIAIPIQV